ncbi:hypothetical protein FB384_001541 [Prauserella sediminis]|uniref:Uncharacterized protein n=1 Tax=Prauserella sediminis TaxID=577680 RepID=A0A839XJC4_9PSEU|nr:hypothetical protein [Prauserella sediminis]MBB3662637.1 hypothetical protein [Prauserella sediminis]
MSGAPDAALSDSGSSGAASSGAASSSAALSTSALPPAADPATTAGSPAGASVPAARQHFSPVPTADYRAPAAHREENGQVVWRVQCGDLIGRERCMTVYVDDDEIVLVGPPGEAARLTRTQLGRLTAALGEAAGLAER